MLNSRSIPHELWTVARKALIYYFSGRGFPDAEDLAQETLLTVWHRHDYEFEKQDDFLKVCYGFARRIALDRARLQSRTATEELRPETLLDPKHRVLGLNAPEAQIFLEEVEHLLQTELTESEAEIVKSAIDRDRDVDPPINPFRRLVLHRVRKKLAKLTGWK